MGICDLIPGISGGTIAFITGIYPKLISSVKAFSPQLLKNLITYTFNKNSQLKQNIKALNLPFLITLFLGIATALLLGSKLIKFLLENYFAYTLAFFIGLIIVSSKILFTHIKNHKPLNISFGIIGFLIGLSFIILIPTSITPTTPYILLGGFIAISAMFLPGISGSFILLIMGLYEFMINALHDPTNNIKTIATFLIGAIFGAFAISRIISYLFKKDKCKTIYVLLGLVLGALSIPIKQIIQSNPSNIPLTFIYFALGMLFITILTNYQKNLIA
jgi:putative membrane protein